MRVPVECVPDPDIPGCGNVFVSIAVDDRIVRAVLDTGASRTLLIDLPASARPVGGGRHATGAFGSEAVTEWQVANIGLGTLSSGPLIVECIAAGAGRHPVVGLDVLGTGPWQLDLASRTLITGAPSPLGCSFTCATNGHVLTQLRWPTATAVAMWDTGAGITMIDRRFADAHPNLFTDGGATTGTDITGSQVDLALAGVPAYEIDGTHFAGHLVAIADLPRIPDHIDAVIGFPTIQQARWTVDVPGRRWSIDADR